MHTLHVDTYPPINYGVDVHHADHFLAGDGPLVAAFTTALGHHSTLISNQVADDPTGQQIRARLRDWGVHLAPSRTPVPRTRVNIVVCDAAGNRTWFSGLRGVTEELAAIDITAAAGGGDGVRRLLRGPRRSPPRRGDAQRWTPAPMSCSTSAAHQCHPGCPPRWTAGASLSSRPTPTSMIPTRLPGNSTSCGSSISPAWPRSPPGDAELWPLRVTAVPP